MGVHSRMWDRYADQLSFEERLGAMAFNRPKWADKLSVWCLKAYPDIDVGPVTPQMHRYISLWRRTVSKIGVWLDVTADFMAYRKAARIKRSRVEADRDCHDQS